MDRPDADRRRVLAATVSGLGIAVAGCLDGESTAETTGRPTERSDTTAETTTDAQSETSTDTPSQDLTMSTVFHFSGDESAQEHAVANVSNLLDDETVDLGTVALVANGGGIKLLVEDESTVADDVVTLLDRGVEFYACHNSMAALDVSEEELLSPAIEVVPAGVGKLTTLQAKQHYAYIETP